jgi:SAM-dependent methyltransferase
MHDDPIRTLRGLAAAAEAQARLDHGHLLDVDRADLADAVLVAESGADPDRLESLVACYGAWFGRLLVDRLGGAWTGLAEPVPPRVRLGGVFVSPMDAVRRRLTRPGSPPLAELIARLDTPVQPPPDPSAWDALVDDPRFGGDSEGLDPWLLAEDPRGKDLLCLAAGGGRHGTLHARAGARVTVVDLSPAQLAKERDVTIVRASMDDLAPLADASFDIVVQPVSTCYVPDVRRVYAEVARVLRPGGLYVAQHKQPASLQASARPPYAVEHPGGTRLPPSKDAEALGLRERGAEEYAHSLDDLLGGLCAAGFTIEALAEPPRADAFAPEGSAERRACFLPPYLKVKARRIVR